MVRKKKDRISKSALVTLRFGIAAANLLGSQTEMSITLANTGGEEMGLFDFDDGRDARRTIGIRDKQILYRNAKGRCQNPGCKKKIDFDEMQVGHKTAWSRRGSSTLANSVCLCYRCNKLQGTDSWAVFMKKQGIETVESKAKAAKSEMKQRLSTLTLQQLKQLATKHKVRVSGYVEEGFFSSRRIGPSKADYVNELSGVVTAASLRPPAKRAATPTNKKTAGRSRRPK